MRLNIGVKLPPSPLIYEINTWPWLAGLSADAGEHVGLGTVPAVEWDAIAANGFDAVWLMGVWQRSPAGVDIARADGPLMAWFAESLPGFTDADVVGSPYSVRDYVVDGHVGGPDGLAVAREQLARRGIGLILDFVPNHVAADHPWTAHSEWFITGTADDLARAPESYVEVDGEVLASGRDPYFPAWRDVVQVNAFHPGLREAAITTVRTIAAQCDGVRCDMAMLVMNDIFAKTWGDAGGAPPEQDYWPELIGAVRAEHPDFRFIAEAYWDTESALVAQGFDHCYDKTLYDTLRHDPPRLWPTLSGNPEPQARVRCIENHDEERAAVAFGDRDRQAAVVTLTQLGARLVHQGQIEGRRRRLPVQLARFADEPVDADRAVFYRALLPVLGDPTFAHGDWQLCVVRGSSDSVVAWTRTGEHRRWLIAVNVADVAARASVITEWAGLTTLVSPLSGETIRVGADGSADVSLTAWGWQVYAV